MNECRQKYHQYFCLSHWESQVVSRVGHFLCSGTSDTPSPGNVGSVAWALGHVSSCPGTLPSTNEGLGTFCSRQWSPSAMAPLPPICPLPSSPLPCPALFDDGLSLQIKPRFLPIACQALHELAFDPHWTQFLLLLLLTVYTSALQDFLQVLKYIRSFFLLTFDSFLPSTKYLLSA